MWWWYQHKSRYKDALTTAQQEFLGYLGVTIFMLGHVMFSHACCLVPQKEQRIGLQRHRGIAMIEYIEKHAVNTKARSP